MINTITYGLTYSQTSGRYVSLDTEERTRNDAEASSDRTVRDTIELSKDGQKIINLGRGAELAAALPDAVKDREAFDAALERAQEDIKRITDLYGGVLNPFSAIAASSQSDGAGDALADSEFAETLARAFSDIRQITNDVDNELQQRQAEF